MKIGMVTDSLGHLGLEEISIRLLSAAHGRL
jgi:hypothetical protein